MASVAGKGATPLLVSDGDRIAGMVVLEDILKPGIAERFERLRRMGLRTVMVTGDNPLTAKAIAQQAGVDDFIAEATPEAKLAYIRKEQQGGKLVAMMGDGTNDAPALAQADVGVAMNSGTQAAKEAGNMVDLDSDPTKLIEVVEIGKQLLMTRGSLTTFSIANDLAKYFAIVPALFAATLPWLKPLDIMHLHSATSAILSAVIFNAIIIPLLIPIALKGVKYRPIGADALLRRNLLVWGLGGVIAPFIGIKFIDMALVPCTWRAETQERHIHVPTSSRVPLAADRFRGSLLRGLSADLAGNRQGVLLRAGRRQSRPARRQGCRFAADCASRSRLRSTSSPGLRRSPTTPRPPARRTGRPTITCSAIGWPSNWVRSPDMPAVPNGDNSPVPTSSVGSRPTSSGRIPASWPSGWICIQRLPRTGSRPILSTRPTWPQWQKSHPEAVAAWVKDNPDTPRAQTRGSGQALLRGLFQVAPGDVSRRRRRTARAWS